MKDGNHDQNPPDGSNWENLGVGGPSIQGLQARVVFW
jgi:hypothetical protein